MFKAVATIIVAAFCLFISTIADASPTPEKQNQYFVALEKLNELPRSIKDINQNMMLNGYDDVIICQNKQGYAVIVLPDDPQMLGLIRWSDGKVLNLYPADKSDWPNDWPIKFALDLYDSQGKEAAQRWLNSDGFNEFAPPRHFIWWDNASDERIVISEDWWEEYFTILIGEKVYYVIGHWKPIVTSVEELSLSLAVL